MLLAIACALSVSLPPAQSSPPPAAPFQGPTILPQLLNWRPAPLNYHDDCPFTAKAHILSRPIRPLPKYVLDACEGRYALDRLKLNADWCALWDAAEGELNWERHLAHEQYLSCCMQLPPTTCQPYYSDELADIWKRWNLKYDAMREAYLLDVIELDVAFYACLGDR